MRAPGRTLRWRKRLGVDQDRNRTILELRRQGKPYAEIGERFGISVSAVAGIVFRHAQKFEVRK
jgi:DNA-binding CsgD family transcriptional regulator